MTREEERIRKLRAELERRRLKAQAAAARQPPPVAAAQKSPQSKRPLSAIGKIMVNFGTKISGADATAITGTTVPSETTINSKKTPPPPSIPKPGAVTPEAAGGRPSRLSKLFLRLKTGASKRRAVRNAARSAPPHGMVHGLTVALFRKNPQGPPQRANMSEPAPEKAKKRPSKGTMYVMVGYKRKKPKIRTHRGTPGEIDRSGAAAKGPQGIMAVLLSGLKRRRHRKKPVRRRIRRRIRISPGMRARHSQGGIISLLTFGAIGGGIGKKKAHAPKRPSRPKKRVRPKKPGSRGESIMSKLTLGAIGGGRRKSQPKMPPVRKRISPPAKGSVVHREGIISILTLGAIGGGPLPPPPPSRPANKIPVVPKDRQPAKELDEHREGLLSKLTLGAIGGASSMPMPPKSPANPAQRRAPRQAAGNAAERREGVLSMLTLGAMGGAGAAPQPSISPAKSAPSRKNYPPAGRSTGQKEGLLSILTLGAMGGSTGRPMPQGSSGRKASEPRPMGYRTSAGTGFNRPLGAPMARISHVATRRHKARVLPTYTSSMQSEMDLANKEPLSALPPILIVSPTIAMDGAAITISAIGQPTSDTVEILVNNITKSRGAGMVVCTFTAEQQDKSYSIVALDTKNGRATAKVVEVEKAPVKPSATVFIEHGLPEGAFWSVRCNDQTGGAYSPEVITIVTGPGRHQFFVSDVIVEQVTYTPNPSAGSTDSEESISISFTAVSPGAKPENNGDQGAYKPDRGADSKSVDTAVKIPEEPFPSVPKPGQPAVAPGDGADKVGEEDDAEPAS